MKQPPTKEHTTHEPDDAPAERMTPQELQAYFKRICGGPVTPEALERAGFDVGALTPERLQRAGFEVVSGYESTGRMLSSLAATAIKHAGRHPKDHDAQGIAAILTALEHAHRHPDDDDSKAEHFRDAVGNLNARNPSHSSGLVRKAIDYMRKPFRGPATPAQQADRLWNGVVFDLANDATSQQVAENFVARLRIIAPDIAKHTPCVPASAQVPADEWRGSDAKAKAVSAVERAIVKMLEDDTKTITKEALHALGCPRKTAHNFWRKKR